MKEIRGFTLIEMLVVMALAAILTALAVPAFRALTTGSSVGETTSVVKNTLDVAQSRAVSSHRYVGVVFDHKLQRDGAEDTQAVRLCNIKVEFNDAGDELNFTFDGWVRESQWRELKYGASVLCAWKDASKKPVKSTQPIPDKLGNLVAIKSVWKTEVKGDTFDSEGVIFNPYGNVRKPEDNLTFTIGEAKIVDKKFIFEDTDNDGVPTNLMQLTLNRFTGRTEVVTND